MARYELYADEAWTHGGGSVGRYFCFYGGIFGLSPDMDRLDTAMRQILAKHRACAGPGRTVALRTRCSI